MFILLGLNRISTDLLLIFFVGYNLARKKYFEKGGNRLLFGAMIQFVIAVAIRLICKHFIDGSVLYDEVIAPGTHIGVSISALCFIKWLQFIVPNIISAIGKNGFVRHLDKISIYVYVLHSFFISPIFGLNLSPLIVYPLFACIVGVSSSAAYWIFDGIGSKIISLIDKKKNRSLC